MPHNDAAVLCNVAVVKPLSQDLSYDKTSGLPDMSVLEALSVSH